MACKPYFLSEPKQRNPQEQRGDKKQNARAIDMFQAKELAREEGCKQERSEYPAAKRQYDAIIKQVCTALERASALLLPAAAWP